VERFVFITPNTDVGLENPEIYLMAEPVVLVQKKLEILLKQE
jgi:hypothetical protein